MKKKTHHRGCSRRCSNLRLCNRRLQVLLRNNFYTLDFEEVPEYMTEKEIQEYYEDLNESLCGPREGYEIIHY